MKSHKVNFLKIKLFFLFIFTYSLQLTAYSLLAQEEKSEPVIVNGDTVEYLTEGREVTATGNVSVLYKGTKLTCDKLSVNTVTKDGFAKGNARIEDETSVIEGDEIKYNFQAKVGTIVKPNFRSNPYFGKAQTAHKVSDAEFIAKHGYMTTCNYDNPHYRIKSRKMDFFPDDKIKTKDDIFYAGKTPLAYFPEFNRNLKDPLMHVQIMPGKKKDWGPYTLTAWRYNLTEDVNGRIYFDYRAKLGVAEGFGVNYASSEFGKGDYKFYYMQERNHNLEKANRAQRKFERYFIRWRHQWLMSTGTSLVSEYYKITDSKRILYPGNNYNFLREYFFREYEKDSQPLSYASLHHAFGYSSVDFLMQKRTNRWYSQTEKLPEIKYNLSSYQIAESPFYFTNSSSYVNSNTKSSVPSPATSDVTENKFDTTNKISLPTKIAFVNLNPFFSAQDIYSDKGTFGSTSTITFSTGSDASTKFYRAFNVKSNFLGMDINNLRHIISPSIAYSFSESSLMPSGKARFGGGATTSAGSSAGLTLSNKLQTKRKGQSIDLLDFNLTNTYTFKPKTGTKRGSSLSDFLFKLQAVPYSWMRVNADATYKHSGPRSGTGYNSFSNAGYDFNFNFAKERSFGWAQRYQLKGSNELTFHINWRLNPKWEFSWYRRYERGHDPALKRGLREQEYVISRDLHCWALEITYNQRRGQGESFFFVCRLKAFPELEFEFNREYNTPKPGSQSNP